MFLKNHLIAVFKKASSENNILLEENIVLKWVHRFGIDSLNDLLIHSSALRGFHHEEENQEQITLIDENHEEENQEQITLIDENHEEENQGQITLIDENHEEENQEQITLIDENHEEENQEQIRLESLKTLENLEETNCESNYLKISNNNEVFNTKQDSNQVNQYIETPKLPLPNIKNLRKWINKDKKAS
ncbi:glycoprotein [Prochlorococcus sp. MIT 9123]|uniref:glycoprotein n=1 Tax=Prochlorococcus sp. MIT 9123 TaxID=3082523 RepID=UPI0039B5202A